jgi:hypothetical protein
MFGRCRLLAVPVQQREAECIFQPPDLLAHGRLRSMHAFARAREAARVDDRDEAAKQVEFEHGAPIRISTGNDCLI